MRLFLTFFDYNINVFQSTHPRRVRRDNSMTEVDFKVISIHAPAKGATRFIKLEKMVYVISIHAPAKGATFLTRNIKYQTYISIHAPAKGATFVSKIKRNFNSYFNPRTRKGCDIGFSTFLLCQKHFNPRTREGCDVVRHFTLQQRIRISIHAPAKGATAHGCTVCD